MTIPEGLILDQPDTDVPQGLVIDEPITGETFLTTPAAISETAAAVGTGLLGTVAGGIAGAGTLLTGGGISRASENIQKVQEFFTREPTTKAGQEMLQTLSEGLEQAVGLIESGVAGAPQFAAGDIPGAVQTFKEVQEKGLGETVLEATGSPLAATAADLAIDVALLATPLKRPVSVTAKGAERVTLPKATKERVKARKQIVQQAEKDQVTFAEMEAELTALGEGARLADVGDVNIGSVVKVAANVTKQGREAVKSNLSKRRGQTRERMIEFVDEKLLNGKDLLRQKRIIQNKAKLKAKEFYDESYRASVSITPELLNNPAIRKVHKNARKLIEADRTLKPAEKIIDFTNPSMRLLDGIKRALDDSINKTIRKRPNEARVLSGVKDDLVAEMKAQSPSYERALDAWSSKSSAERALADGEKAFKGLGDPSVGLEFTKQQFDNLSTIDKAHYRLAAGEAMKGRLKGIKDTVKGEEPPSVLTTFAGDKASKELLSTIFKESDDFIAFNRFLERERTFAETNRRASASEQQRIAMQESARAPKLLERLPSVATDILFAANQNRFASLRLIQDATGFFKRFKPETATEMANILFDPSIVKSELQAMKLIAGEIPKSLTPISGMGDKAMLGWFRSKQNRRAFYEFGAKAAIIERQRQEAQ